MRILIAPNAFKGSLTAADAAEAMSRGARRAAPRAKIDLMPVADGGDGLIDVLLQRHGGRKIAKTVLGPIKRPRRAEYALIEGGRTAVIEMACASGIADLRREELDALGATSYGTGELIADALDRRVERIVVGMGGSATNDGGAGMAMALGARLLDASGRSLRLGAAALSRLARIDARPMHARVRSTRFIGVSDVRNPLLGPLGSARVYGPQKGATPSQVCILEAALGRYARFLRRDLGRDVARLPGAGAAGGLGAGLAAFVKARLVEGSRWVLETLDARRQVSLADLVISGEGRLDRQSFFGKAPVELARIAQLEKVPVAFVCGGVERGLGTRLDSLGFPSIYLLTDPGEDCRAAMRDSARRLTVVAQQAVEDFL